MSTVEPPRLLLLERLLRAVAQTAAQHALFSQALAAQLGIAPTDLACLTLLQDLGPATPGQLGEVLNLTSGAVTGVVDRLVSTGFVLRETDPADRRRVIVQLVPERTADLDRLHAPVLVALDRFLSHLGEAELAQMLTFEDRAAEVLRRAALHLKAAATPPSSARFSAPLGDLRAGRLEFPGGAAHVRIHAAHTGNDDKLYEAAFEGVQPNVREQDGEVIVRYRRMGKLEWGGNRLSNAIALNPSIPWRIAIAGGASRVSLDARGLRLTELAVEGGLSRVDLALPPPEGHVNICLDGGLDRVQVQHPLPTPVELQVRGGANRLEFDVQRFGAVGGNARLATPGWDQATDRYAIEARGGASRLVIQPTQEVP